MNMPTIKNTIIRQFSTSISEHNIVKYAPNYLSLNELEMSVIAGDEINTLRSLSADMPFRLLPGHEPRIPCLWQWRRFQHKIYLTKASQQECLRQVIKHDLTLQSLCLYRAALRCDLYSLHSILQCSAVCINEADSQGNTALHFAASKDHLDALDLLLAYGATTSIKNEKSMTALDLAIINSCDASVDLLLAHGAEPSSRTIHFCIKLKKHASLLKCIKQDLDLLEFAISEACHQNEPSSLFMLVNCVPISKRYFDRLKKSSVYPSALKCLHVIDPSLMTVN